MSKLLSRLVWLSVNAQIIDSSRLRPRDWIFPRPRRRQQDLPYRSFSTILCRVMAYIRILGYYRGSHQIVPVLYSADASSPSSTRQHYALYTCLPDMHPTAGRCLLSSSSELLSHPPLPLNWTLSSCRHDGHRILLEAMMGGGELG